MFFRQNNQFNSFYRGIAKVLLVTFSWMSLSVSPVLAAGLPPLPPVGQIVSLSAAFVPPLMRGMQIFPKDPLKFDFFIDMGETQLGQDELNLESEKLIKYFLAALTLPEEHLWVNLSPVEADRVAPGLLSQTDMGRDLLVQDYLLKQVTSSILYPEHKVGFDFWDLFRQKAYQQFGTSDIPVETHNKVWIVPEYAKVYVQEDHVFIVDSHLKVMTDRDYASLKQKAFQDDGYGQNEYQKLFEEIFEEKILPELTREINDGQQFAPLRQIYHSLILAAWYKKNLRQSILGQVYADQNSISGIDLEEKHIAEKVYDKYLEAFQKGVYNYIREEYDPQLQDYLPRKYFSGGIQLKGLAAPDASMLEEVENVQTAISVQFSPRIMRTRTQIEINNPEYTHEISRFYQDQQSDAALLTSQHPMKRMIQSLALTVGMALFSGAFSLYAQAADYQLTSDGQIQIHVEKGDTFGHILEDIRVTAQRADEEVYSASELSGSLWGLQGVAQRYSYIVEDPKVLQPGEQFIFPTERLSKKMVQAITASSEVKDPQDTVLNGQRDDSPANGLNLTGEKILNVPFHQTKDFDSIAPNADISETNLSYSEAIKRRIKATPNNVFYILGGVLFVLAGLNRKAKKEGALKQKQKRNTSFTKRGMQVRVGQSVPATKNQKKTEVLDIGEAGILQRFGLKVVQTGPKPLSDEDQQAIRNRLKQTSGENVQADAMPLDEFKDEKSKNSWAQSLRWMDATSLVLGGIASYVMFGVDSFVDGVALLMIPLLTRFLYSAQVLFHETIGHVLPASIVKPGHFKEFWTKDNIRANVSPSNWIRMLIPGWFPDQDVSPHVDVKDLNLWQKWIVQKSGFVVSLAASTAAVLTAGHVGEGIDNTFMTYLLAPWVVSSTWLLTGSFKTDVLDHTESCFRCGNFFMYWMDEGISDDDMYPEWVEEGIKGITGLLRVRGGMSAGQVSIGVDRKGRKIPVETKVIGTKRGFTIDQRLARGFSDAVTKSKAKKIRAAYGVKGTGGHVRFPTVGKTELKASHPHRGPVERSSYWQIQDGRFVQKEQNDFVYITHNGDNKSYRLFDETVSLDDTRDFFANAVHMKDKIASGDSPVIALQMHFFITQGVWRKAVRYGFTMKTNRNFKEAQARSLSMKEEDLVASLFEEVFVDNQDLLLDLYPVDHISSLQQIWVTQDMLEKDPTLQPLVEIQEQFIQSIVQRFRKEQHTLSAAAALIQSWDLTEETLEDFIRTTTEKFFVNDRYGAVREFQQHAGGAFGLVVRTSLRDDGVVIFSKNQGMSFGYNQQEGYFAGASDHITLMSSFGNKGKLDAIIILDPDGGGEVFDLVAEPDDRQFQIRGFTTKWSVSPEIFSGLVKNDQEGAALWNQLVELGYILRSGHVTDTFRAVQKIEEFTLEDDFKEKEARVFQMIQHARRGHEISMDELKKRAYVLNDHNPYYRPLVEYEDPTNIVDDDIRGISAALASVQESWQNQDSFNRRTSEAIFYQFLSLFLERYLHTYSDILPRLRGKVLDQVYFLSEKCNGGDVCDVQMTDSLVAQMVRIIRDDSLFLKYIQTRANRLSWQAADQMATALIEGRISQDQLYSWKLNFDQKLTELIDSEIERSLDAIDRYFESLRQDWQGYIAADNTDEMMDDVPAWQRISRLRQNIKEDHELEYAPVDLLLAGYENSQWLAENMVSMLEVFFPELRVKAVSTNKLLTGQRKFGVHERTIAIVFSKSGSTFPSRSVISKLEQIIPRRVFGVTSRVDSLLSLALGQQLSPDAPFQQRIFVTGDYYPAETATVSETALAELNIEFVIHLVKQMYAILPQENPFGLSITEKDLTRLAQYQRNLVEHVEDLTGFKKDKEPLPSILNKKLKKKGKAYGWMLRETPLVNMLFRMFVFGIFFLGAPVHSFAELMTGIDFGPPLSSVPSFFLTFMDFILAISMPFLLTITLRMGFIQRPVFSRMGPPSLAIGEESHLHQILENKVSKFGAQSPSSMNMAVRGANPADHFVARLAHRVVRGTEIIAGLPSDPKVREAYLKTLNQAKTIVNSVSSIPGFRWMKAGARVTTIGYGSLNDPDASDEHINLGTPDVAGVSDTVRAFYRHSFESLGRSVAYNVIFNEAYKLSSRLGPFTLWMRSWTFPSISVHTTESPVGNEMKPDFRGDVPSREPLELPTPDRDKKKLDKQVVGSEQDAAMTDAVGGIDLNPGWVQWDEGGRLPEHFRDFDIQHIRIDSLKPVIIEIVPVTPIQLQMILGLKYESSEKALQNT